MDFSGQQLTIKKPESIVIFRVNGPLWTLLDYQMVEAAGVEPASLLSIFYYFQTFER